MCIYYYRLSSYLTVLIILFFACCGQERSLDMISKRKNTEIMYNNEGELDVAKSKNTSEKDDSYYEEKNNENFHLTSLKDRLTIKNILKVGIITIIFGYIYYYNEISALEIINGYCQTGKYYTNKFGPVLLNESGGAVKKTALDNICTRSYFLDYQECKSFDYTEQCRPCHNHDSDTFDINFMNEKPYIFPDKVKKSRYRTPIVEYTSSPTNDQGNDDFCVMQQKYCIRDTKNDCRVPEFFDDKKSCISFLEDQCKDSITDCHSTDEIYVWRTDEALEFISMKECEKVCSKDLCTYNK